MNLRARFVQRNDPDTSFEVACEDFLVGRSKDCQVCIRDPHVSRRHAKVHFENGQYVIEDLGRNPTLLNGQPFEKHVLKDGDVLTLGQTELVWELLENADEDAETSVSQATVVLKRGLPQASDQRLVVNGPTGGSSSYAFDKDRLLIGRSEAADVRLDGASVSREHAVIEKRQGFLFVTNLSKINPLTINNQVVSEQRLYDGDRLKVGSFELFFFSDRYEDRRPIEKKTVIRNRGLPWAAAVCAVVAVAVTAHFLYTRIYVHRKIDEALKAASQDITAGSYGQAQVRLEDVLESPKLPSEDSKKAEELLAKATLSLSQKMLEAGRFKEAKHQLAKYLRMYGAEENAAVYWDMLDFLRLKVGQEFESAKKYKAAATEYASVGEDGPHYNEAQAGIRRVWRASQHEPLYRRQLTQLLEEGQLHFKAGRYLTPPDKNAFFVYQAVLSRDPESQIARERINEIKLFYEKEAGDYMRNGDWSQALLRFQLYSLIDPDDEIVKEQIFLCRKRLQPIGPKVSGSGTGVTATGKHKRRADNLSEESGAVSPLIVNYLFGE